MKRTLKTILLTLILTLTLSTQVFAASQGSEGIPESAYIQSTGDAVKDILLDDRFSGALDTISVVTEFIDIWFIRIISLVSFFIISAAMLKNVCAGAYVANSKFWDKVHDAHEVTANASISQTIDYFKGGQFKSTSFGSMSKFLLNIVPDIKAFTDFEDADIEPKAYFMKAIPQMIACVCIGIFIYNGFYRDTAAKVGEMGSVLIDRTLNSVNPESLVNSIFNTASWPPIPWENDPSLQGQLKLAVAKELKSIAASNFNDIGTSAQKTAVLQKIVDAIDAKLPSDEASYTPPSELGEGYVYKVSNVTGNAAADTSISNEGPVPQGNGDINYTYKFPLNELVVSATETSATQVAYIRFTLKLEASSEKQQLLSTMSSKVSAGAESALVEAEKSIKVPKISTADMPALSMSGKVLTGATAISLPIDAFGLSTDLMSSLYWDGKDMTNYSNGTVTFTNPNISLSDGNKVTIAELQPGRGKRGIPVVIEFAY